VKLVTNGRVLFHHLKQYLEEV
jgi:hypothetical protein